MKCISGIMKLSEIRERAIEEGREARGRGTPFEHNPYIRVINPTSWNSWREGWRKHEREND